ncbi:(2Fe-2S)-binding protein [Candidatus Haliotispira prima]|uniref:(2Fe-2S)-binding protein n=1 Tax=Candidatus Haliotispira prima TaxID=3034016 RepID=A0ABY8MIP7_9SPIO|nr:(2Fe-2S)-binding protein [Candidatus Haliotispira prima]
MSEECGSGACGCASGSSNATAGSGRRSGFCPKCNSQVHPVSVDVLENILKPEAVEAYKGEKPSLCLNPSCDVTYFDAESNEVFTNEDCETGIWFKEKAENSYVCYCQKVTEREIIETVVETGLDDLGSVMLYLREDIGEGCKEKQPAGVSCNRYVQDAIEKAQIIREALFDYKELQPDSKEIPYQLIEERYNNYLVAQGGSMATAGGGGGCCGGGCGCG